MSHSIQYPLAQNLGPGVIIILQIYDRNVFILFIYLFIFTSTYLYRYELQGRVLIVGHVYCRMLNFHKNIITVSFTRLLRLVVVVRPFFFFLFFFSYHSWRPGNRNFYLMSHSIQLPPARDLGPGVIILQYLKSKEDSICVLT